MSDDWWAGCDVDHLSAGTHLSPVEAIGSLAARIEERQAEAVRESRARLLRECGYDIGRYREHLRSLGLDPRVLVSE